MVRQLAVRFDLRVIPIPSFFSWISWQKMSTIKKAYWWQLAQDVEVGIEEKASLNSICGF